MTLLQAAQAESLVEAAWKYHLMGFCIIPLQGKLPAPVWMPYGYRPQSWKSYQGKSQTRQDIQAWINAGRFMTGVGLLLGDNAQRGLGFVVIDCDGLETARLFEAQFPALVNTFTILSGSGQGKHFYYFTHQTPKTRYFHLPSGNVELRANGCYIVAAPSIHPNTRKPYTVANPAPVLEIGNLDNVTGWMQAPALRPKPAMPTPHYEPKEKSVSAGMTERGAQTVLSREAALVRSMPEKGRNIQLNRSAYNMGQLVGVGVLPRADVETVLYEAARAAGLSESESRATIYSGLEAGIRNPRKSRHNA